MNTALTIFFVSAGAFALVVIVVAGRRGMWRGKNINRILSADASARDVRRAAKKARRQRRVK